jgi:hypothetical protein
LIIPNDVIEVEGDLLFGFIANDVRDFLHFHGRRFEELGQTALAGNADGNPVLARFVAIQELLHRFGDQQIGLCLGLAQQFRIFNIFVRLGNNVRPIKSTSQCLESALTDFNSPNAVFSSHRQGILAT